MDFTRLLAGLTVFVLQADFSLEAVIRPARCWYQTLLCDCFLVEVSIG